MLFATFENIEGETKIGLKDPQDGIIDLVATNARFPRTMRELIESGPESVHRAAEILDRGTGVSVTPHRLLAPVLNPSKVICIGLNYADHAAETKAPVPEEPVIFNKFASAIIGPNAPIILPAESKAVDYEAELVAVIGKRGKNIPADRALDYVAGYTCGHDVSARDWQLNKSAGQWLLGKTFDTFAPMGPYFVTKDEIPDPQALTVEFRLNGKVMQQGSTATMIFPIKTLIAYASRVFTLEPGDVIYTGTPPGVGMARTPPVFLKDGDQCEVRIEGVGVLTNPCRADSA